MILEIDSISKSYGKQRALDNVSMRLSPGIYALLGPNGAGKTTLMNILTGNLPADSGSLSIDGKPLDLNSRKYKEILGYVPQYQTLYMEFTVYQFMVYVSLLRGIKQNDHRIRSILQQVDLAAVANKRIEALSGGMKQRLMIAQALIHEPQLLILDEPTAGLDPKQRVAVRNIISEIAENRTVIIATHIVQDVECLADGIILLSAGKVLKQCQCADILNEMKGKVKETVVMRNDLAVFRETYPIVRMFRSGEDYSVRFLLKGKTDFNSGIHCQPELEDVYLWYFGE